VYEDGYLFSNSTTTENEEEDEDGNVFETVIVKLESVISGPVTIGDQDEFTLNIYEDDALIILEWLTTADEDVDMDLTLWVEGNPNPIELKTRNSEPSQAFEGIFIPGGSEVGDIGLSYTYYSGLSDSVNFQVSFVNFGGTVNGQEGGVAYQSVYKLANKNRYDTPAHEDYKGVRPVVQTLTKTGLNYTVTDITKSATSSRMRTSYKELRKKVLQPFNVN
jgi:hypothetical protein